MSKILLFNKPFQVLSQFTDENNRATLKDYLAQHSGFYPAGRLDYDSEGLLLLTDDGVLQQQISAPRSNVYKTYWAQVEGEISTQAIAQLQNGVILKDGKTRPAKAKTIQEPAIWPRTPPIRQRQLIPTSWLELQICEGKNRQVRRMTAAVGFPTLRLIRAAIGDWHLNDLQPGQWRMQTVHLAQKTPAHKKTAKRD